jgi:hypothetical protein
MASRNDLIYMLQHGNSEQRGRAITMATNTRNLTAIPYLDRIALEDSDPRTRNEARHAADELRAFAGKRSPRSSERSLLYQQAVTERERRKKKKAGAATVFPIFGLIGLMFVIGVGVALAGYDAFKERATLTEGVVIDMLRDWDDDTYLPVVEFFVGDRRLEARGSIWSSPPQYRVGDRTGVYYDPADPREALLADESTITGNPLMLVFGALGLIFVLVGAIGLIPRRRPQDSTAIGASGRSALMDEVYARRGANKNHPSNKTHKYESPIKWT